MREPPFWWRPPGLEARLLSPFAALYGAVASSRLSRAGARAGIPVVCIGNPTVGGAGKTPLALAVAPMLAQAGHKPVFLTRGYGGKLAGPIAVDAQRHTAAEVGDEPLLLARAAPTIVARDRVRGAEAARAAGAQVIVMDDGFQNPALAKDLSILVVDARRGIGNARVLPAGPLRAALDPQLRRAQALIVVGEGDGAAEVVKAAGAKRLRIFRAQFVADAGFASELAGQRVLAFAGMGDPQKFFATLAQTGVTVAATRVFADHHRYTAAEAEALCVQAEGAGLALVTTEKDWARLQGDAKLGELARRVRTLPVRLGLDDEAAFRSFLLERIAAATRAT
jgi:tetraacyldisaccharide 4'-kinase